MILKENILTVKIKYGIIKTILGFYTFLKGRKMVDEKKLKAKGNLPQYIRWPLYLNFIWLVMAALGFTISIKTGVLMTFAATTLIAVL